jgi:hypothetical protein
MAEKRCLRTESGAPWVVSFMASDSLKALDATKERIMEQFQATRQAQRFLPAYDWISNLFFSFAQPKLPR